MYHTMSSMRDQCFTSTYFVCQMYLRQYRTDEDRVEGERGYPMAGHYILNCNRARTAKRGSIALDIPLWRIPVNVKRFNQCDWRSENDSGTV